MGSTIVHFGQDICFRVPVLRSAGYTVEACESLEQLPGFLSPDLSAVTLEDTLDVPVREAAVLTRAHSSASVVLFQHDPALTDPGHFDLVIPTLTAPEEWLQQIAALLEKSRNLCDQGQLLAESASLLRGELAAVRDETRRIRERSISQRIAAIGDPWNMPDGKPSRG